MRQNSATCPEDALGPARGWASGTRAQNRHERCTPTTARNSLPRAGGWALKIIPPAAPSESRVLLSDPTTCLPRGLPTGRGGSVQAQGFPFPLRELSTWNYTSTYTTPIHQYLVSLVTVHQAFLTAFIF